MLSADTHIINPSKIDDVASKLAFRTAQLKEINAITQAINNNVPVAELYENYIRIMKSFLSVDRIALFINDGIWTKVAAEGREWHKPDIQTAMLYEKPSAIYPEHEDLLGGYRYVIPVIHKHQTISYAFLGNISADDAETDAELLLFAQTLANIITVAVENKRLFKREISKRQLEEELKLASRVQKMLIPRNLPKNHFYEFAGLYLPFKGIGGDYYDVISINKDELVFCIGDISGKGIASALVMANLQAYLNAVGEFPIHKGKEMAERLNSKIYHITNSEHFITLFIGKYNVLTRQLEYLNAGHNPPMLLNGNEVVMLDKGCTILGMFDEIPRVHTGKVAIQPGATIVCYTDGLTEMENDDDDFFGVDRLNAFLKKHHNSSPEIFIKVLYDNISKFKGSRLFNDDVSVLVGKFP